jgi:2'-5' RNA ligase
VRAFVAVVPPAEAVEHLDAFLDVRRAAAPFRWTAPEQVHVTLAFFADAPDRSHDDLAERLGRAAARRLGLRDVVAETDDDRPIR